MKITIILLLILFMMTACASQPAATPQNIPGPIPVTADTPVATVIPVTGATLVTTDIPAVPSIPLCTCPTSMVTPAQPQTGVVSPDHIICNCPAILVPPPVQTIGNGTNALTVPANGITLADNGKTFLLHTGESFLLNLGMDEFNWTVNIDDQNVVFRERNVMPVRGAQGVYQAGRPGQAVLSAVGNPICQNSTGVCMALAVFFKVTVIVE